MRFRSFAAKLLPSLTLAFALTQSGAAHADSAGAQAFVQREHASLKKMVDANTPDDQVRKAISAFVDYDELAKRSLGKPCPLTAPGCKNHWDELTEAQRDEVKAQLTQLVALNYLNNLKKTRDYDVTFLGAKDQGDSLAKVRTEAKNKAKQRDPAVTVDYVILESGSNYKAIDIITEGSSLTKNYYDQIHKMLTTQGQGYPYLIQKLKEKVAAKQKEAT